VRNIVDNNDSECKLNLEGVPKIAGRLQFFVEKWAELTSDKTILSYVTGCKIDFENYPKQTFRPRSIPFGKNETAIIDSELATLQEKGVLKLSEKEPGEYISTIFTRPKKNGSYRLILNLKKLNEDVDYFHFKMDTLHTCVALMTPGCYMASLDLRDAYYSVPIHVSHQKYLKFRWKGDLYQFTCLPNGLACAPRIFTKLLKPVFAHLRKKGHISSPYLDDSFLMASTYEQCKQNVMDTLTLLKQLGFVIHVEKSHTQPSQCIEHLGFIFNSVEMTIKVNAAKIQNLRDCAREVLIKRNLKIRKVAQLIGIMVSCFPGVEYGQLFYRRLDMLKTHYLKLCKGNFEAYMKLDYDTRTDIRWWISNIGMGKEISHGKADFNMTTDASFEGWGAVSETSSTGGRWDQAEKEDNINVLEIKAVCFGLKALCKQIKNKHIHVKSDNTTAVAYLNHMGGSHSTECNDAARETWLWCIQNNNWLSVAHIPGRENTEADAESRIFSDLNTEWKLCVNMFDLICTEFGKPDIDLFASRLNYQCKPYVAWRPDPEAISINAFSLDWGKYNNIYLFPPFSMLTRVLQKVQQDEAQGIVVAPDWPTQAWYPKLIQMTQGRPLRLPMDPKLLTLAHKPDQIHPLATKMQLMVCRLSG